MGAMLVRHEPTSASAVRRELALDLELHGFDDESVDTVTLVASELVGNAIRHAGIADHGELDVGWTVGAGEVYLSVEDPSSELPRRRYVTPDSPGGRGLAIVEALTAEWGVDLTPRGKRVWAKLPVKPQAA
ncbi:MAG TPA: ATP-binding protein [Jatrophihabitantaceae bacterium]|nr:ATP-binding protein [Jatrophihabitantaceae bacterium]